MCVSSPSVAHHELTQADAPGSPSTGGHGTLRPSAISFHAALVFVDISGFTPLFLSDLVDVDQIQGHINAYFSQLIEVRAQGGLICELRGTSDACRRGRCACGARGVRCSSRAICEGSS